MVCGYSYLSILFLSGTAIAFWFVSFCVLKTWLRFPPVWAHRLSILVCAGSSSIGLEAPKNTARKVGCNPFVTSILPPVVSSHGNCLSAFLLVIFESGSEYWEGCILCTFLGDASCPQLNYSYKKAYWFSF